VLPMAFGLDVGPFKRKLVRALLIQKTNMVSIPINYLTT
jgi:hypothetical protein